MTADQVDRISAEVCAELLRAMAKFGPMASPHEGKAVIEEELEELWELVKANLGHFDSAREEAIQVAAMAMRYVHDVCDGGAAS